jgi:hypothetical protein
MDTETVSEMAQTFVKSIFTDLEYVRAKLDSHGNAIINRWTKKNVDQRRAILLKAFPDMFDKKFPQAHITYGKEFDGWVAKRPFRKTWLLPYLTLDNLSDDKTKLIALLHHRRSSEPQEWVQFDSAQFNDAYTRGRLEVRFHVGAIVMQGSEYGKLVAYDKNDIHRFATVWWPRARLILEAQAELYGFLHRIIDIILEDYTGPGGSDKWLKTISAGLKLGGGQEFLSPYTRAAFSAASKFDPSSLLETALAREAAGEDDLWLLSTDAEYALLQTDHLRKLDFYKDFASHEKNIWGAIVHELTTPALYRSNMWRWVRQELEHVAQLSKKYDGQIDIRVRNHERTSSRMKEPLLTVKQ